MTIAITICVKIRRQLYNVFSIDGYSQVDKFSNLITKKFHQTNDGSSPKMSDTGNHVYFNRKTLHL